MDLDLVSRSKMSESDQLNNSTVQIPKELLNKLLSSVESFKSIQNTVENLQQAVSRLEGENAALKADLETLHDGRRFPQFSRLPLEIRRMIWTSAFMMPRIHIFESRDTRKAGARCSRHKQPLLYACKESRELTKMLQTPFTWLARDTDLQNSVSTVGRQFINRDIDTVWLNGELFDTIEDEADADPTGNSILRKPSEYDPENRLNCLVINYFDWDCPSITADEQHSGAVNTIYQFKSPRNLFILVGSTKVNSPSRLRLIEPRWSPYEARYAFGPIAFPTSLFDEGAPRVTQNTTWKELALRVEHILTQFKEVLSMDAEKFLEEHHFEIDIEHEFDPNSVWEVPKISYVEALEDNPDWIEYPTFPDIGDYDPGGSDNTDDDYSGSSDF